MPIKMRKRKEIIIVSGFKAAIAQKELKIPKLVRAKHFLSVSWLGFKVRRLR